jgi:hypothetical protein
MTPKIDLFNQPVWNDGEYMVIANFTEVWPQYYVYELRTGQAIGTTNATNYMGTCRMIINDFNRQQYATEKKD